MRAAILAIVFTTVVVDNVYAAPTILVMRADSSVDWETRVRVEAGVLGLARHVDRGAGQSETRLEDITDVIGCVGDLTTCKAAVLDTLAVDEIVVISIAPAGDAKARVVVRRAAKTGAPREASAVVETANPEPALVASIGPLFGASRIADPARPPARPAQVTTGGAGAVVTNTHPRAAETHSATLAASSPVTSAPTGPTPSEEESRAVEPRSAEREPEVTAAPRGVVEQDDRSPRGGGIYLGGIVTGGALAIVGVVLWKRASDLDGEIAAAPDRTRADIDKLLDLETRADRYVRWGNITFFGGAAIAAASGVLLWRHRRSATTTAHAAPVILDHGGGVALTFEVP